VTASHPGPDDRHQLSREHLLLGVDGGGSKTAALAGGVVSGSQYFRDELSELPSRMQPAPEKISVVYEPVMGCLKIAQAKLLRP